MSEYWVSKCLSDGYVVLFELFEKMSVDMVYLEACAEIFEDIYQKLLPYKSERNIRYLIPVIFYRYAQNIGVPINLKELLNVANIQYKKFRTIQKRINEYIDLKPHRLGIISNIIIDICERFHLGIEIEKRAHQMILSIDFISTDFNLALAVVYCAYKELYQKPLPLYKFAQKAGLLGVSSTSYKLVDMIEKGNA